MTRCSLSAFVSQPTSFGVTPLRIPSSSIQTTPLTSVRMPRTESSVRSEWLCRSFSSLFGKGVQGTIALALYDRVIGLVELMLAHDDSAASSDGDVSGSLRQSRDDLVVGRCLGGCMTCDREEQYQGGEAFLHVVSEIWGGCG